MYSVNTVRAPRQDSETVYASDAIVGKINTESNSASTVLKKMLIECCQELCDKFEQTWTILGCSDAVPVTAPILITKSGSYCLSNDIAGTVTISADNVYFDLNQHTISGGSSGIVVNEQENVFISNGIIENQTRAGIEIASSVNVQIENLELLRVQGACVFVETSSCIQIKNSVFIGDFLGGFGIELDDCDNGLISQNKFSSLEAGVSVDSGRDFVVEDNQVSDNINGIDLRFGADNNIIRNNKIQSNSSAGIVVADANDNIISGNLCVENFNGINLGSIRGSIVRENICNNNISFGIFSLTVTFEHQLIENNICNRNRTGIGFSGLHDIFNNRCNNNSRDGIAGNNGRDIVGNVCDSNGDTGIALKTSGSLICGNVCNENRADGIRIEGDNNQIIQNKVFRSGGFGITLSSGTGNLFFENNASRNGTNYFGVPASLIITFDESVGDYLATNTRPFINLAAQA